MNLLAYVHLRNIYRSTGVGRVSREFTEHLARRPEIRLEVLADRQDHANVIAKVGPPWTDFRYHFFQHDTSRQQALWYLLDRPPAEQFWPEVDVVYCPQEAYVPVRKARLAVTSHDMQLFEPEAHPPSRWRLQQRLKWTLLFRRLEKRADLLLAISTFSAERMAHFFPGTRSRIQVIPNAVSEAFFQPTTEEGNTIFATLGLTDRPYVLVPGGLHFRKNAELILETWPMIRAARPELTLVIMGHNAPEYVERAAALGTSVVLTKFLEEEHMVALLHGAQAVWFPSKYEGFGLPVLEAMACGAPVIASNTSAVPETAGGAAVALLAPDQPQQHVGAIVGLLEDPAARERAREHGRQRAAEFTWPRSAALLANALEKLA